LKYLSRLFSELEAEFARYRDPKRNLPLIEAVSVIILISRAMAESVEIFPQSVSRLLVSAADSWAWSVAPLIDRIYGSLNYVFSPDVCLSHLMPPEAPTYPLPVWMISLWSFSLLFTFSYWLLLTAATYGIGRALGGRGSYLRLLTWTGIAHIPLINWWFYVGCEMLYEIVRQEIYMSLLPPYSPSAVGTSVPTPWGSLPNFAPVEGFWAGYGFGVAFMIMTLLLLYGFVGRELELPSSKVLISLTPWIIYMALLLTGSMNIEEIVRALDGYVRRGDAWRWIHG